MPDVSAKAVPKRVSLTTARFRLQGLDPANIGERQAGWLSDPDVAQPLNRAPVGRVEDLRREVAGANGVTLFYVGIFDRAEAPVGFFMIKRDPAHRTAHFNVLIGEKRWWGEGVVLETRAGLLDHFFAERGIDKAIGMPLARNFPAVFNYKRQGWRLEGTLRAQCLAHDGSGRLDQLQFALLKEEWQAMRKAGS